MKISTGRGIKFFKLPTLKVPKNFAVKAFNDSKKNITKFVVRGKKK